MTRLIPHGTANGYNNYRCRCNECRDARRKYATLTRQRSLQRLLAYPNSPRHGKIGAYLDGCRCDPCSLTGRNNARTRRGTPKATS